MGLLSNMFGTSKPVHDPEAAAARVEQIKAALPSGTTVLLIEPSKGMALTYIVQVVADRRQTSTMTRSVVEIASAGAERWSLSLEVYDVDDPTSTYSAITVDGAPMAKLEVALRAHDDLYAIIPSQSIGIDVMEGGFNISDVSRGQAAATARAAIRWWEGVLQHGESGQWSASTLSVDVGGDDLGNAEISYGATIEREVDPMGKSADGRRYVSDAEWNQRVFTAWNDNLLVLEALLRLPLPAEHEVEISFDKDKIRPRITVTGWETRAENKTAAKELVAQIGSHVPDAKIKVY
ncbi:hypothetical protein [Aeromicrobium wangtongii]|uniref:hypothetical protein n=1 Tax=Aeromicrobium wangtongii TaxID=2969247 RepID=UPI0020181FFF|nr:hypothetical protein [Aeromicrobium wangtongii]MCL3817073.1 hypothetical protein [Aeromicrobium wangtongii]